MWLTKPAQVTCTLLKRELAWDLDEPLANPQILTLMLFIFKYPILIVSAVPLIFPVLESITFPIHFFSLFLWV